MEAAGGGVDEVDPGLFVEHFAVIGVDRAVEFAGDVFAAFPGKRVGDGDDLELVGLLLETVGVDVPPASSVAGDPDFDDFSIRISLSL